MGVYSSWDSFLLNMVVKVFFLTKYFLYDFLLRDGGDVWKRKKPKYICPEGQDNKTQSRRTTAAATKLNN
jgi:hypothetical protein